MVGPDIKNEELKKKIDVELHLKEAVKIHKLTSSDKIRKSIASLVN